MLETSTKSKWQDLMNLDQAQDPSQFVCWNSKMHGLCKHKKMKFVEFYIDLHVTYITCQKTPKYVNKPEDLCDIKTQPFNHGLFCPDLKGINLGQESRE